MAGKRKFTTVKKTFRKKPSRARGAKKQRTVVNRSVVAVGQGFPKKMLMTHKYVGNVEMTFTAGGPYAQRVSCNGMYDPDLTSAGHQPMYFDQMTALYNHYCIIGSRITWRITPKYDTSNNIYPIAITSVIDDNGSFAISSPYAAAEASQGKPVVHAVIGRTTTIKQKWSAKKFFGKGVLANTDLQGTSAANPAEQSEFILLGQPAAGVLNQVAEVSWTIEYIAMWKELKDVAQS